MSIGIFLFIYYIILYYIILYYIILYYIILYYICDYNFQNCFMLQYRDITISQQCETLSCARVVYSTATE